MIDAALHHASLGYHVHPLRPGTKVPATSRGYLDATTAPDQIRAWWTDTPDANIGIACVNCAGWGCDTKHGVNCIESLERLTDDLGVMLDYGWFQTTPSGGRHYVTAHDARLKNRAGFGGDEYPGLDLRCTNGYIVAAPSVTPEVAYVACADGPCAVTELPAMSEALVAWLLRDGPRITTTPTATPSSHDMPTGYGVAALNGLVVQAREARPGTRNDTWARVAYRAGVLVAHGHFAEARAIATLCGIADDCGDDPHKTHDTIRLCLADGVAKGRSELPEVDAESGVFADPPSCRQRRMPPRLQTTWGWPRAFSQPTHKTCGTRVGVAGSSGLASAGRLTRGAPLPNA